MATPIPSQNRAQPAQGPQGAMPLRSNATAAVQLTPEQRIQQMLAMGQITPEQATQMLANMQNRTAQAALPVRRQRKPLNTASFPTTGGIASA